MFNFKYSVIKYMPDAKRGEVINVGLIVFADNSVDVRILNSAAKIRMIDGVSSLSSLESLKEGVESIARMGKNPGEAFAFLKSFGDSAVSLGEAGIIILDDINQYEKRVQNLFNELVRPYSSKERAERTSRISTYLKNKFDSLNILGKDTDDLSRHKIVQNYPLNDKTGFTADFLLKNGRFHITETIDFNVNDVHAKFKETTMKVMTFMEGRKALGEDTARYFVYSASASKEKEIMSHINLAEEYSDKLFNLDSKEESASYFTLIANLAGQNLSLH